MWEPARSDKCSARGLVWVGWESVGHFWLGWWGRRWGRWESVEGGGQEAGSFWRCANSCRVVSSVKIREAGLRQDSYGIGEEPSSQKLPRRALLTEPCSQSPLLTEPSSSSHPHKAFLTEHSSQSPLLTEPCSQSPPYKAILTEPSSQTSSQSPAHRAILTEPSSQSPPHRALLTELFS